MVGIQQSAVSSRRQPEAINKSPRIKSKWNPIQSKTHLPVGCRTRSTILLFLKRIMIMLFQILALLFGRSSLYRSPFSRLDGGRTIADRSLFLVVGILHRRAVFSFSFERFLLRLVLLLVVVVVVGGRAGHVNVNTNILVLCREC